MREGGVWDSEFLEIPENSEIREVPENSNREIFGNLNPEHPITEIRDSQSILH